MVAPQRKVLWSTGSRNRGTVRVGDKTIKARSQIIYGTFLAARLIGVDGRNYNSTIRS